MKNAPTPSLIQDELAEVLVTKLASKEILQQYKTSPFLPIGINCLAIRTRVIDDWLLSKQQQQDQRQIVNLGAGMCARPYRLNFENSNVVIYEVDDLHLLKAKRTILRDAGYEPRVKVVDVAGDVTSMKELGESLLEKGFDSCLPTDWICEGLFAYLDPEHHLSVLKTAKQFGGGEGSRFVLTTCDPFCREYVTCMMGVDIPWAQLRPIADIVDEMVKAGWSKDVRILGDDDFWRLFQRAITLPIPIVMAES